MFSLNTHTHRTAATLLGAALMTLLCGGCESHQPYSAGWWASQTIEPAPHAIAAEPTAIASNTHDLGASDSLGQSLLVEKGYRYASAASVFQMAAAEDATLGVDRSTAPESELNARQNVRTAAAPATLVK